MAQFANPYDHAFANGPVFDRVTTLDEARQALAGYEPALRDRAALDLLSVWTQFDEGAVVGAGVKLGIRARLINLGERGLVRLTGPCAVRGILRAEAGGEIDIGQFVYIGDDVLVSARHSVTIGRSTLLAHGVQVFDNNSHPTQTFEREVQFRRMLGDKSVVAQLDIDGAPVVIGENCWIGLQSVVLRGVEIGRRTIVAAGSVVTRTLPDGVVAAGNPAETVRQLTEEELRLPDGVSTGAAAAE